MTSTNHDVMVGFLLDNMCQTSFNIKAVIVWTEAFVSKLLLAESDSIITQV